jgi:FdhD protein
MTVARMFVPFHSRDMSDYLVSPDPKDPRLTERVTGVDQDGKPVEAAVTVERPLTLFLNGQEIVTMMTIGDYPDCLAVGFLLNQNMLQPDDEITGIDYDAEIDTIVVRTARETDYEQKLKKKTRTSGCAVGTVFGDVMEKFDEVTLDPDARVHTSWLYALSKTINTTPSLYLEAGAIHGCVLCERDRPLIYMEDVGRHNAVDKIAGYMFLNNLSPDGKLFYTTGRLTSEMVLKTVQMRIPVLVSRSGFTAWGVDLARQANLTLIGRARGRRFLALAGEQRIVFDAPADAGEDEPRHVRRKGSLAEDAV